MRDQRDIRPVHVNEDLLPGGTFFGDDDLPTGTWHGGDDELPPGTWHTAR